MKTLYKKRFKTLLLTILFGVMMAVPTMGFATQPTVNLATTSRFAILAGSTITNTGTTKINGSVGGDVGLSPGTAFTGQASVSMSGSVHLADAVAIQAKADLVIAYNDANGRQPVTRISSELGGTTLTPGTYDSVDGTFQITGILTLDAKGDPDGVFVFKTASTLITASGSSINLINKARFCRTFWKVGSSATLGTNSHFVGHIFALTSITANTGAMVQGQLLARNGAVTLDTNTITNGICEIIQPTVTTQPTVAPILLPVSAFTPLTVSAQVTISAPMYTPVSTPNPVTTTAPNQAEMYTSVSTSNPVTITAPTQAEIYTPVATQTYSPRNKTVTGGQLPNTATPWYNILLVGIALTLIGSVGLGIRSIYE